MPNADEHAGAPRPHRVSVERGGPVVVEGPVEVVTDDGAVAVSRRFAVAICTCRRSTVYPWCDTSHRTHGPPPDRGGREAGGR